jgi:hypothetical protein
VSARTVLVRIAYWFAALASENHHELRDGRMIASVVEVNKEIPV